VYRVQILFGVATDTYDALGIVGDERDVPAPHAVRDALPSHVGTFAQTIPPFASYRVNGKPLFHWARRGLADTVSRPSPLRTITAIDHEGDVEHAPDALLASITRRVRAVRGDFRQNEIVERWRRVLSNRNAALRTTTVRVACSSGTFMRALANDLGRQLDSAAIALHIERLSVGRFDREHAIRLASFTEARDTAGTVHDP
jgi:tRNA pseudouridine55 synthase